MNRVLLTYCLIFMSFTLHAQTLSVRVPSNVQNGENFHLVYTLDTQSGTDFRIGEIPDALEIITGPYTSTQSSFQMVNGHTSSSSSITYTFILCANKNGTYTIPPAHVHVNGKTISSQSAKITVSGNNNNGNNPPRMHDDYQNDHQMRAAGSAISGNDLFIKVSANKKRVHEQEPVLLTYKVYTLVDLTQLEGKMPDLTGFHSQEVKLPQQKSFHIENVNGRNYRSVTWSQYVMYPQMTGKLEIPSITFNGTVVQQNRNVDPFEAFFNGGSGYVEVKRSIKAPGLIIQVDPLPKKPDDFSGGVGHFNISAQLNKSEIKANDPITIRVVVGGVGNLKLIKQPVVTFPKDFDKYDAKITDKTKLTANGVEGNMIYDFLAVPRNPGKYTIPAVTFTYYDTTAESYKTIKTQPFDLTVEKGSGNVGNNADYTEEQNQDIHAIKTGKYIPQNVSTLFFGSFVYWTILLVLLATFLLIMIIFRRRAIENADIVKVKGKKANKIATKRLKLSHKLMLDNKQNEFYDEVLRALWGYVGDKMNIPVTELSHDNIEEKLRDHNIDQDTISKFLEALDSCEYARYAPDDVKGNMNKTFETAMDAITKIEESMKVKRLNKFGKSAKTLLLTIVITMCVPTLGWAITKEDADGEYSKGNYQQAINDYEELLKTGACAELYYNLGNAYYRTDNITRAIINYERALLLSPSDDDIRFNLQMARSKTIDKITPKSEMFFITWMRSVVNLMNVDGWARLSIFSLILSLILVLAYLFAENLAARRVGFYGGILFLLLFIFSNVFAYQQKKILENRNSAIIVAPSTTIKKTPASNASDITVIHEGTKVEILDNTMKDWKGIRLTDGRDGWIQTKTIEKI